MKKTFRLLVICLAFVLCMLPGLVACDPETVDTEDTSSQTTAENTEGTASETQPTVAPDKNPDETAEETTTPAEDATVGEESGEQATAPDEQVSEPDEQVSEPGEQVTDEAQTPAEEETDPAEPEVVVEGTRIAKSVNGDETLTLVLHQLSEADADGIIKCSLVIYNAQDEIQNYMLIDFISNGKKLNVLSLKRTTWLEGHCVAYIANGDGSTPSYELTYTK